jgi:pimeloyl-ACP methyl ester carboxylesterase
MHTVLLPGLDGTGDLFEPFLAAAPPDVHCVVMRYPVDQALGYDELAEYAAARLPPEGELVLIGESFSGPIAVRLAERFSSRVTQLVLCNSFVTPPRSPLLRFCARTPLFRIRLPERIVAWLMLAPLATPALVSAFSATLRKVAPHVLAHRVRELLAVNEVATLERIAMPVTYLRGTRDKLVPDRALVPIEHAAPAVQVHFIEAPHALLQTAPAAAWRHIALARHTRTYS